MALQRNHQYTNLTDEYNTKLKLEIECDWIKYGVIVQNCSVQNNYFLSGSQI